MSKELIVGDYHFSSLEEAKAAKVEQEKIDKLNEKLINANPDILYKVYNKSIEKNTFKTPVGLEYLHHIKTLLEDDDTYKDVIVPIPVNTQNYYNLTEAERKDNLKKYKKEADSFKNFFKWSLFINAILVVIIIALFAITSTSKNPNIINYENAVIDKYSAWETELKDKEKELNQREKDIIKKERELNNSSSE
ncbi:MAG: hypothetical protein K5776_08490 [Lachnospiraceae bacterium]|nr:hypothetical protein [Lachnospiraceae bacterium]